MVAGWSGVLSWFSWYLLIVFLTTNKHEFTRMGGVGRGRCLLYTVQVCCTWGLGVLRKQLGCRLTEWFSFGYLTVECSDFVSPRSRGDRGGFFVRIYGIAHDFFGVGIGVEGEVLVFHLVCKNCFGVIVLRGGRAFWSDFLESF